MHPSLSAHCVAATRRLLPGLALALALVATGLLSPLLSTAAQTPPAIRTVTFGYTGGPQTWTVPAGVTQARFTVYGAQGGSAGGVGGGKGGEAEAILDVTPGATYQINVGGQGGGGGGFNGGGMGGGGGAAGGGEPGAGAPRTCATGASPWPSG